MFQRMNFLRVFKVESPFPANFMAALGHSMSVKGDTTNFEIDPSFGVEATELYPD
ncbi:isoflavone reductase-like protein, partial [Trifolium medium]|nr:isoflavone reductase-like protein [Trifolium medium]